MKEITEIDLLNSVKSLTESIRLIEAEHMGSQDELQTMLSRLPNEHEASPAQPEQPSVRMGSQAELKAMMDQDKQAELAVQPGGLDDISKQSTSSNFARPFYDPKANKRDHFQPSPEDSFYNPSYSNDHFDQDFTPNQQEVDQATRLRQSFQGQQNPKMLIRTPNGPQKITLSPNDRIAEDIDRIMQIAKWQG